MLNAFKCVIYFAKWSSFMKLSIKSYNGIYFASLSCCYDLFYESNMNVLFTYKIKIICENLCSAYLSRIRVLKVQHTLESIMGKLLGMKNEFKYFGSLSIVTLILILTVLYDAYVLD